jgi:hypothetical protein
LLCLSAGHEKYTYFLLAAAGAAIGFAVQKTEGLPLSWWLLPVGIATALWAASFYFGCRNVNWVSAATSANFNMLQLKQGTHPEQPPNTELTAAAIRGVLTAVDHNVKKAQFYAIWQFRLLITGTAFFVAWRVLEMIRITN